MAKFKTTIIDDEVRQVRENDKIIDVVSTAVESVITSDGVLIPRERFSTAPIPDGFQRNLSSINKG